MSFLHYRLLKRTTKDLTLQNKEVLEVIDGINRLVRSMQKDEDTTTVRHSTMQVTEVRSQPLG